jgi:very-short-patch-repair endonuclease
VEIDDVLCRWGGVATRTALVAVCGRAAVDRALHSGSLTVLARGRYAAIQLQEDIAAAYALSGHLSHESAALRHGWAVLEVPDRPHVTVPAKRKVAQASRKRAWIHYADLHVDEVTGAGTSVDRTLGDCLRALPFASALAVADSALRSGCSEARLIRVAGELRGPGAKRARTVAGEANALAANPFESALRAICLGIRGLKVRPQVPLYAGAEFLGRPDLVDTDLGIVIEADSFQWHGTRGALVRDAQRYNGFAAAGWLVLRFTWEDVFLHAHRVEEVLRIAVARQDQRVPQARRRARKAVVPVRLPTTTQNPKVR